MDGLKSFGSDPATGGTLRPCPALALRAMCPLLAVASPFWGAYVRMPPSFRGVSSVAFGAHLSIARIGRCLPHGWCDHPALICGLVFSRAAYLAVIAATDAGG